MRQQRRDARSKHRAEYWERHERSTYQCPDCGRGESHPSVDQIEVHHIDGNALNGDPENLIGLCRHCHYVRHDASPPTDLDDWKARVHTFGKESKSRNVL